MAELRFATLGLFHEANTFSPLPADLRLFEDGGVFRGEQIIEQYAGSSTTYGGYLAACAELGIEVVPLLAAFVTPTGVITGEAFESLVGEMIERLEDQGPWDGVLLNVHGAAVSEHFPDADAEIAARVRSVVGPEVPVGAVLDMHANVSRALVDELTVTLAYQTNPHVDPGARAEECTRLVLAAARGEIRPEQALVQLPLVVNIARQDTAEQPMADLVAKARELKSRSGVLSVSVVEGFPYADVPEMGMSCIAIHNGDRAQAEAVAQELARSVWEQREALQVKGITVQEALDLAVAAPEGPVVLLDVGDNIGGGAPGDSTEILAAAVKRGLSSLVQTLWDPVSARRCTEAGVGAQLRLEIGAKNPHSAGHPVTVVGQVKALSGGRFEEPTPTHAGFRYFDAGPTAVLETTDGHTIVLNSRSVINSSLRQLHSVGVDPLRYRIVVAKGVNSPRAAYGPIAKRLVVVDTDGVTAMGVERFTYHNRRKPLYPFEDAEFPERR
ncbi:M81 family metallopeptidase [Amycolatopsis acidicola]|uniref:M81 family metallopeptidase n=1 Tax=Amycolatopsis acidicola TaxID=2596893 RepID=A0A5N0VHM0_9PSEU|nr:M81 family metallopeptidase [Amycolatopsis acidicola]KAA9164934.1 M81 family metallopeptidase [Amycolatopsis acidicola]